MVILCTLLEIVSPQIVSVMPDTSLVTGGFPSLWKYGLKSGDIDDVNNYRSITIFPILSKILETDEFPEG